MVQAGWARALMTQNGSRASMTKSAESCSRPKRQESINCLCRFKNRKLTNWTGRVWALWSHARQQAPSEGVMCPRWYWKESYPYTTRSKTRSIEKPPNWNAGQRVCRLWWDQTVMTCQSSRELNMIQNQLKIRKLKRHIAACRWRFIQCRKRP